MDEWGELRNNLVQYVKSKFSTRPAIYDLSEDIVDEAIMETIKQQDNGKCNFGYLSKVSVHIAYRYFKRLDNDKIYINTLDFIDTPNAVDEIMQSESAAEVLNSLDILKQVERVIILQRYYGDYSFAEIAAANNIKLNTVLSHHRRALEKLRPELYAFSEDRVKKAEQTNPKNLGNFSKLF